MYWVKRRSHCMSNEKTKSDSASTCCEVSSISDLVRIEETRWKKKSFDFAVIYTAWLLYCIASNRCPVQKLLFSRFIKHSKTHNTTFRNSVHSTLAIQCRRFLFFFIQCILNGVTLLQSLSSMLVVWCRTQQEIVPRILHILEDLIKRGTE